MTIAHAIRFLPAGSPRLSRVARTVAASLPVTSLAHIDRQITFVSGEANWDDTVLEAIRSGARAIILDRPDYVSVDAIHRVATALSDGQSELTVRAIWSSHAMIEEARSWVGQIAQPVLIDVTIGLDDAVGMRRAAIGAVQMVHALVGAVRVITFDSVGPSGFQARGLVGDAATPMTVFAGPSIGACDIQIRVLGTDSMVSVAAIDSIEWTSIGVWRATAQGKQTLPAHLESPDRTTYRRLLDGTDGSASDPSGLNELETVLSVLRALASA